MYSIGPFKNVIKQQLLQPADIPVMCGPDESDSILATGFSSLFVDSTGI
ncbi:MAG: hypothetical protein IPH42_20875 [Bacteroidetes bacterium]|nr:hypothetical protein [Bacteroidota bacterium]